MENVNKLLNLTNSFYIKKIKENSALIFVSLILAIICVFISYPGIWYSDSYTRVAYADMILHCGRMVVTGERSAITAQSWITIIPSFFMAVCKLFTGNIASYTLLQAFMLFLMTFLLIKKIDLPHRWIQYVLFAISPLVYGMSVYYEASVGCMVGIVALILLLSAVHIEKTRLDRIIEFFLLMLFSLVTFGYRANAFTIIPVLIGYIVLSKCEVVKKVIAMVALGVGFSLVSIIPGILNIDTMSSVSAGFAWEILTTIQNMEPQNQEKYLDYLDEIGGDGATILELKENISESVNGFLWEDGLNTATLSEEGAPALVLEKYVQLIFREPQAYLKTKIDFTKKTLGISTPINYGEYNYNRWNKMSDYGFNDCKQRELFVKSYDLFNEILGFYTCQPWLVFLITTLLVAYEWIRKNEKRYIYILILLIAIFYYGAYIINTQSFELRYFYPSLYLMSILNLGIALDMILVIHSKIIKKKVAR